MFQHSSQQIPHVHCTLKRLEQSHGMLCEIQPCSMACLPISQKTFQKLRSSLVRENRAASLGAELSGPILERVK